MIFSREFTLLCLLAMGGLSAACSAMPDRTGGLHAEDMGTDTLVPVDDTTQVLAPGSERKLHVRYRGEYPAGREVEFAVVALETSDDEYETAAEVGPDAGVMAPPGGSLAPDRVTLFIDGEASTTLTVGTTPGRFRVRARVEGADPVFFNIEVSEAYPRPLSVKVQYDGLRSVVSRSATALAGMDCEQAKMADTSRAEVRTLDMPDGMLSFSLMPQQTYAIMAWGRDGTNAELANGCMVVTSGAPADNAKGDLATVVNIYDTPMRLSDSTFPVELGLKVDASMARLASVTTAEVQKLLPAAPNAEAKAYLDTVHGVLVASNTDNATLLQTKRDASMEGSLAAVLSTNKAGLLPAASALSTLLTSFGKNLAVHANYGVGAPGVPMSLTVSKLVTRSEDGSLAFDLMTVSGGMSPTATILADFDESRALVDVKTLSITLGVGTYGRALLDALAKGNEEWFVARLGGAAGCAAVQDWLANDSSVRDGANAPLCDQACAALVCKAATKSVADAARTGFSQFDVDSGSAHATISLAGKLSAHDRVDDDAVDDLGPSPVTGNWGKAEGAEKEDTVSGEWKSQESTLTL